jgi:hypothetical protein
MARRSVRTSGRLIENKCLVGRLPDPTQLQEVIQGDGGKDSEVTHTLHCAEESAQEAPEFGERDLSCARFGRFWPCANFHQEI